MRSRFFLAGWGLLLWLPAAMAAGSDGNQPARHGSQPSRHAVVDAQRRVAAHATEVKRLQDDVARQEQASKQANDRLQQQDQAIAELQKQLREARSQPAAGHR
jgi:chromosome segregation ATPase